ncbi:MAG TPA: hypothetical protein VGG11_01315 [Xanthobacteraceae bacterium]|jgi:hypothetical protein
MLSTKPGAGQLENLEIGQQLTIKILRVDPKEFHVWFTRKMGQENNQDRWQWRDNWKAAWDVAASSGRLLLSKDAETWLGKFDLDQRGWTSVWTDVWIEAKVDAVTLVRLADLAETWLELADAEHPRWAAIWLTLWKARGLSARESSRLVTKALKWLFGEGDRDEWDLVWSALWDSAYSQNELMVAAARRLIARHPSPKNNWIEQQLANL